LTEAILTGREFPRLFQTLPGDKTGTTSGTDISNVYLAYDSTYLYVKIDLADGSPNPSWTFYSLFLDGNPDNPQIGDQYLLSHYTGVAWPTYLKQWISFTPPDAITVYQDIAAPGPYFLEMRMPLSYLIKDPFIFYAYSQTDPAGPYFDRTSKIEAKLTPILDVLKYYQFQVNNPGVDPNWPDALYDHLISTTTETIRYYGCALTSSVMLLRFHNVSTGIDQKDVNPYNLNEWLKNNEGYLTGGDLKFEQLAQYSTNRIQKGVFWDAGQVSRKEMEDKINIDLAEKRPVLIKTEYINLKGRLTSHYVVAKGVKEDTWFINDPGYQAKTNLAEVTYPNYQNKILGIRTFKIGSGASLPRLTSYFASPGELFLTDPLGRRTGIDPETNQFFAEVPRSSYVKDEIGADFEGEGTISPVKSLDVSEPLDGDYKLQIIGTNTGSYVLTSDTVDQDGNFRSILFEGITKEGIISTFNIDYSSVPGELSKLERVVTIQDAVNDVKISYELGWITKKFVKDILVVKLEAVKRLEEQKQKQLDHFDELIEKAKNPKIKQALEKSKEKYKEAINKAITAILKSFIKEVEIYTQKGWIVKQSSEILIEDARYIIEHL